MSYRLHWFKLAPLSSRDVKLLSEGMLRDKYQAERGWGFDIEDVRRDIITGRFIERESVVDEYADPFGAPQRFERIVFHQALFRLDTRWPNMEVTNAPRDLSAFFSRLGEYTKFQISISPVRKEPAQWIGALRNAARNVVLEKAVATDITVTTSITGQVALSGTEDVEKHLKNFLRQRSYNLDSAQLSFRINEENLRCEINSSGRLRVLYGDPQISTKFFRGVLQELGE
jgi:hypothetical protein